MSWGSLGQLQAVKWGLFGQRSAGRQGLPGQISAERLVLLEQLSGVGLSELREHDWQGNDLSGLCGLRERREPWR